jgi:DnaJ-class molecular chaperone
MHTPCAYCGNTGTVNGDWCPVCHPRRDTWTRAFVGRATRRHQP